MKTTLQDIIKKNPVMAALCREEDLDDLCLSRVKLAYIFCGTLKTLPSIVERVRKARIIPFVYMDFIDGLSSKDSAVDFVKYYTNAAGIVTTKSNQVRRAKALEMLAIQRFLCLTPFHRLISATRSKAVQQTVWRSFQGSY